MKPNTYPGKNRSEHFEGCCLKKGAEVKKKKTKGGRTLTKKWDVSSLSPQVFALLFFISRLDFPVPHHDFMKENSNNKNPCRFRRAGSASIGWLFR